jgi:hypothetical protein
LAAAENTTLRLFRAVSPQELADIRAFGSFRSIPGAMEGKWFAEVLDHAIEWGKLLYPQNQQYLVVRTDVPQDVADLMFRVAFLDRIGPARYADEVILQMQTQVFSAIIEV